MGEHGDFLEMLVILFEFELGAENRVSPARVDNITGADLVPLGNRQRRAFIRKIDFIHAGFFANLSATFRGMIEQDFVEVSAGDLLRAVGLRTETVFKIKLHAVIATGAVHFAAKFFHEPGLGEFVVQSEAGERLHAERQERFADVEARKLVALEHDDAASGAGEEGGSHTTGRSAADNCYVIRLAAHWVTKVANFAAKQRLGRSRQPKLCSRRFVFVSWHLHEKRICRWIQPAQQIYQVAFRHRRASGCRGAEIFPDVQEDTGTGTGRSGWIVSDHDAPFIENVVAQHLFGAAPIDLRDSRSVDEFVVVTRARIVDSLRLLRQRKVGELDPTRGRLSRVTECGPETKNSRGRFVVTFDLLGTGIQTDYT